MQLGNSDANSELIGCHCCRRKALSDRLAGTFKCGGSGRAKVPGDLKRSGAVAPKGRAGIPAPVACARARSR